MASVKWQWAVPLYRGVLRIQIFCVRCLAHTRRSTHSGPTHHPNVSSYCLDCPDWGLGEVVCKQPVWPWARLAVDYSLSSPVCTEQARCRVGWADRNSAAREFKTCAPKVLMRR